MSAHRLFSFPIKLLLVFLVAVPPPDIRATRGRYSARYAVDHSTRDQHRW